MNKKEFRRNVINSSSMVAMSVALALVRILPYGLFSAVIRAGAFLWFTFAKRLRKIARESMTTAFGDTKSPEEIQKLIRQCFDNVGSGLMDLAYYAVHPQRVHDRFVIENQHYLDEALAQGKGVVLVTAHFGNFPLMLLELSQHGYKVNVILRRARNAKTAEGILGLMNQVNVKTIYSTPPRESVRQSLQVLRDNETLCVLMDQNFGAGSGVFVDFFGHKAATATGPVVLAERTGAVLLPVFNFREGDKYRLIFEPPVPLEYRDNHQEMLVVNVSRLTRLIESYIRRYPAEWGWMHRRWKTKESH